MPEHMVRCSRCHEVFDTEVGPCTKCGAPYVPPVARPEVIQGLYTDKYAVDDLPPLDPSMLPPVSTRARRPNQNLLLGGGVALIVTALAVGMLYVVGGGSNAAPAPPQMIVSITSGPTTAALPAAAQKTLTILNDPMVSAQIKITSRVDASAAVVGQGSLSTTIKFDGEVSGGNQWGTYESAGIVQELRLIDGQLYRRFAKTGKWETLGGMPSNLVICPIFAISKERDIQFVKQENVNGQDLLHLQTTRFWTPDLNRLAMTDMSLYLTGPDVEVLDLWTTLDGTPVIGKFSGTRTTGGNTKLIDVQVTYTFAQVGVPMTIDVPGPHWSPSPTASAGA
jgi:hypothetical protein